MSVPLLRVHLRDVPIDVMRSSDEQVQSIVAAAKATVDAGHPGLPASLAFTVEALLDEYSNMSEAMWGDVAAAEAAGRDTFDLVLEAPLTMASACETWLRLLDHLEDLRSSGEFDHPATPDELRAFRRWLVASITDQLRGTAPLAF